MGKIFILKYSTKYMKQNTQLPDVPLQLRQEDLDKERNVT